MLTAEEALDRPYSWEAMADAGSMLGSGSIIVFDDTTSVVELALRTARFYHHESCGKCTPCREGTNWTVKMLERMIRGEATPIDLETVASVQDQHHRQLPLRARRLDGDAGRRRWCKKFRSSSTRRFSEARSGCHAAGAYGPRTRSGGGAG